PELREILSPDISEQLTFRLNLSQLSTILRKRTNLATFAQGTAALIPGVVFTYYLISLLSDNQKGGLGIETGTATILGLSFAFGRVIGYPIFGFLGDYLSVERKNRKAIVATVCMTIQGPLFMISFFFAAMIDSGETAGQENVFFILNQPFFILFGIFFFLASFVGGGSGPNRRSLLWDVNSPEHRGSTGAIFHFTDQMGAAIGLFFGSLLLSQADYLLVFALVSLFYFVAATLWMPAIKSANEDSDSLRKEMRLRANSIRPLSSYREKTS
ncbi:MAG: MFS transporter, partial [Candidatus Hodarchaeota archaeon]